MSHAQHLLAHGRNTALLMPELDTDTERLVKASRCYIQAQCDHSLAILIQQLCCNDMTV